MGLLHFGHFGRKGIGLIEDGQQNCRLQARHKNRCLPDFTRPYLLRAVEPHFGQTTFGIWSPFLTVTSVFFAI